jgi:TPR repeat protein
MPSNINAIRGNDMRNLGLLAVLLVAFGLATNAEEITASPADVVAELQKAADQGHALSQTNLGNCYRSGHGVPQDYKQAVFWFQKAADQGDAFAQTNLGNCYRSGHGVPQDHKQAVVWFQKAADQGDANGQAHLGICYANGEGVPQHFVFAYQWFNLAAVTVSEWANERDKIANLMTPEQIAEGQRRSSEFKAKPEVPVK